MAKKDEAAEAAKPQPEKVETIKAKSALKPTRDSGNPIALWEVDPQHPEGEIFIAGDAVVEVAKTPAVMKALADNRIVEVK